MKKLYLIRHAKSDWGFSDTRDFERPISQKGKRDLEVMGALLSLKGIEADMILSSCALRTQETADDIAKSIRYHKPIHYLEELYLTTAEQAIDLLMAQDSSIKNLILVSHNPQIYEVANILLDEHISKVPTLGIISIELDIDDWSELLTANSKLEFFVYPKQFKNYLPKSIRDRML